MFQEMRKWRLRPHVGRGNGNIDKRADVKPSQNAGPLRDHAFAVPSLLAPPRPTPSFLSICALAPQRAIPSTYQCCQLMQTGQCSLPRERNSRARPIQIRPSPVNRYPTGKIEVQDLRHLWMLDMLCQDQRRTVFFTCDVERRYSPVWTGECADALLSAAAFS
jgi:hypothetical protein